MHNQISLKACQSLSFYRGLPCRIRSINLYSLASLDIGYFQGIFKAILTLFSPISSLSFTITTAPFE